MGEQVTHGGRREGSGRKMMEGRKHTYRVADDVHDRIVANGGGEYLTKTIRVIIAISKQATHQQH